MGNRGGGRTEKMIEVDYFALSLSHFLPLPHIQMGYDCLFFARNDYDDKNQRLNIQDNMMEMVWRPSRSLQLDNASDLFTGIMLLHYIHMPCMDHLLECVLTSNVEIHNLVIWMYPVGLTQLRLLE